MLSLLLSLLLPARCAVCDGAGAPLCPVCMAALRPAPPGAVTALVAYDGAGRTLVTALKYRNRRAVVGLLGTALAQRAPPGMDVVTWAPTTAARRRERGFDQAELLARAVGRCLGVPCRALLRRLPGRAQTGRGRAARLAGPRFTARGAVRGRVLLVDDVVTTGATLRAAAGALRAGGACEVVPVAVAATPRPVARVLD